MRVCFVVPSDSHKASAGSRIRYGRFGRNDDLGELSASVAAPQEVLKDGKLGHDVYVFSKVYGALPALLARKIRAEGKLIGIDIYDDYYTQWEDVRLGYFRTWLRENKAIFDFALCSTPAIKAVIAELLPDTPTLMLPDPGPPVDLRQVLKLAERKARAARASRSLDILWFGIATNPFFPVGLRDLVAFGDELAGLSRSGWNASLTIVTDAKNASSDMLAQVARLPAPARIEEWSEPVEAAALARSFACFIPVNAQSFSRAKSLNRAISALSSGCQVLSPGYQLYSELVPVIYDVTANLLSDLERGRLKFAEPAMRGFEQAIAAHANVHENTDALLMFLAGLMNRRPVRAIEASPHGATDPAAMVGEIATERPAGLAILQGAVHDMRAHELATALGAVTVRSSFTTPKLNCDLLFQRADDGETMAVLARENILRLVAPKYRAAFAPVGRVGKHEMHALDPRLVDEEFQLGSTLPRGRAGMLSHVRSYSDVMRATIRACKLLLPDVEVQVSELGNLHLAAAEPRPAVHAAADNSAS